MRNILIYISISFCLFGCATIEPISTEQYNKINRIGIISVVGEKIELDHFGPTIFNIDNSKLEINFNVDQYIVETIKNEIGKSTPFKFVATEYDYNEVAKVNEAYRGFTNAYEALSTIKEELREIITKHSLDALVLVMKKQTASSTLQHVDGVGILEKSIVLYRECHAYMFGLAFLIDGLSIEPMSHFGIYKHTKIDKEYCPEGLSNFTDNQVQFISNWTKTELQNEVHEGLTSMGIIKE